MTTFTKAQLEAMQAAWVPMQWDVSGNGDWADVDSLGFRNPPEHYRPRPGFTFDADTAWKLRKAGVEIDARDGKWFIADSCEPIANQAGRPICLRDLVVDLEAERDALKAQVADLKARLDAIREEADYRP